MDGRRYDYEVAGLVRGLFTMIDRQTGSIWNHFDGKSTRGVMEGSRLEFLPLQMTTFGDWKAEFPNAVVLAGDTGFESHYVDFEPGSSVGAPDDFADTRLPENALVIGVESENSFKAYPQDTMTSRSGVVNDVVGQRSIVVFHDELAGAGLAYSRVINGVPSEFERVDSESEWLAMDTATESIWNAKGIAISGPLEGEQLDWVSSFITEWYGWYEFHPDTEILGGPEDWAEVTAPPRFEVRF